MVRTHRRRAAARPYGELTRAAALSLLAAAAAAGAGCGDNLAVPDAGSSGENPSEYQPSRVGLISLVDGVGGSVSAVLHDRSDPLAPEVSARAGVCTIYVRRPEAVCTPACSRGVCTAADECTPDARAVSAGVITITGLRQGLIFRPGPRGYQPESPPPSELFESGARIHVSAPGDVVAGFTAELGGVPPLEAAFELISLRRGKDTRLTWTAAGVGRIAVTLTIGRPGAPFSSMLLCEADDNGALSIPASVADKLPAPRGDELQAAAIMRLQRALVASAAGPIEIIAGSQVPVAVERP